MMMTVARCKCGNKMRTFYEYNERIQREMETPCTICNTKLKVRKEQSYPYYVAGCDEVSLNEGYDASIFLMRVNSVDPFDMDVIKMVCTRNKWKFKFFVWLYRLFYRAIVLKESR